MAESVLGSLSPASGTLVSVPRRAIPGETDLATTHPELAAQLVDPNLATMVLAGSKRVVDWRCSAGHQWDAPIDKRAKRGFGCPYCSGRRVLAGYNDLATTRPDLAAELADQELAPGLSAGSHTSVTWRCALGHEWDAPVANRAAGRGCPYCAVPARAVLAGFNDLATTHPLVAKELVDSSLAVELSAGSNRMVEWRCAAGHGWTTSPNTRTSGRGCPYCTGRLTLAGETDLATVRPDLAAELVQQCHGTALAAGSNKKVRWRCADGHEWDATVANRVKRGSGCPYCSGLRAIAGRSDLGTLRPDLAAELVDRTIARELTLNSTRRVDWQCPLGHVYTAQVSNRSSNGSGCPFCAGRAVLLGFNDLATVRPDLAAELVDPDLAPSLTVSSGKRVDWRCPQGHLFVTTVDKRSQRGDGCPECAPHGFSQVSSGWFYLLAMPGRRVFKFGIANDIDSRLDKHRRQGFTEVIETIYFDSGADALAAEGALIRHARASGWGYGLTKSQMRDGWTETLLADDCGDDFTLSGFLAGIA